MMRVRTTLALLAATGTLAHGSTGADVAREGSGERRAALDSMERQPFPDLWANMTDWSASDPLDAGGVSGKVVLIVTWASWYTPSQQVLSMSQELYAKHAGDGLIVVGLHHPKGYDAAKPLASARGVTFPIAHDRDGKVRETLRVDQDPDFYVIDRAGQLRFADVATGSVREAVETLLAESRSDAAEINQRLAEVDRIREESFRRSDRINQEVDLRNLPEIPFTPPSPEAWAALEGKWPEMPTDGRSRRRGDDNAPRALTIDPGMQVLPRIPPLNGRARVVYFWHPDLLFTHEKSMRQMDDLQKRKGRDLVVVGVLTPNNERRSRNDQNDEANDPVRLATTLQGTFRSKALSHALAFDPSGAMFGAARGDSRDSGFNINTRGDVGGVLGAPAAVISSDGIVRWFGNSATPAFQAAVDQVLRIDPGVAARRAAEEEYIRTNLGAG